jgi:dihydrofolate reductase
LTESSRIPVQQGISNTVDGLCRFGMTRWRQPSRKNFSPVMCSGLGRVTYEEFVAAWPLRSGDAFTDKMNSMKKLVASRRTATPLEWNATLIKGDVVEAVKGIKQEPGDDILVYGSRALVHSLMPHSLIDEYRFIVYPLVLGEGKRLFEGDGKRIELDLLSATTTQKGVTLLTYGQKGEWRLR